MVDPITPEAAACQLSASAATLMLTSAAVWRIVALEKPV
jgi:hypothetical protein